MPDKASSEYRGEVAAAAFERVLEAEGAAEASVAASRRQAAEILAAARDGQRTLHEDVERRIGVWRLRLAEKADANVAALEREAALCAAPAEIDAAARERIARAVARLAGELVDGD